MELKPGYKQTEVGVIPEEWEVKPFTQVTDLITCGIAATPEYVSESQGYPFLSSTNVKEGRIIWSGYKHISANLHRQLYRNNPPKRGDILYSRVGTFGEAGVVDVDFEFSVYVSLTLIKPGRPLDSWYLMQLLNSNAYKQRAKDQIYLGGGVGNLNVDVVRRYPIVIPPLPEQRAIATALSDVDGLLGGLDRLIAKKRDLKQAAMQQLLTGQTRLPGFDGEWEVKEIGNYIDLLTGFPFPSADYCDAGIRLLRGSNVKRGVTDWSSDLVQCWPMMTPDIARYELHEGDLVIAMDGSLVGRSYARIQTHDLPAMLLQRVARIRSTNLDIGYLTQFVGSDVFISYCDSVKTVTAIPHISPSDIRNFRIPVPPTIAEQTAIAEVLTEMDAELAALAQRREKTRALKQAMMQELLTGRTRLQGSPADLGNGHATAQEAHA